MENFLGSWYGLADHFVEAPPWPPGIQPQFGLITYGSLDLCYPDPAQPLTQTVEELDDLDDDLDHDLSASGVEKHCQWLVPGIDHQPFCRAKQDTKKTLKLRGIQYPFTAYPNPFKTAVLFWGQTSQILSSLHPNTGLRS